MFKINVNKLRLIFQSKVFFDYTVQGKANEYLEAIDELCSAIQDDYPTISKQLRQHIDSFYDDKILHYTAMKTIVDCILSLVEGRSSKKIFISHSSHDKDIIEKFTDHILQLGIGLSHDGIFCTSIEDMGIKNGEDIRRHIRENVQSADFSFLMISKYYKESEICLNEMGAVWAADNQVRYYLLPDVDFKNIGWLCDTKKTDTLGSAVVLDALEEELTSFYGLPHRGAAWSRQREIFLEYLAGYAE